MEQSRPAGMSGNRYCKMMRINRTRLYYEKKGESAENVAIMSEMGFRYLWMEEDGVRTIFGLSAFGGLSSRTTST